MNNKESKSYKDMYHFTNSFYPIDEKEFPSLEADPKINTSIKKNPYKSNVEIEKDEIILKPDMSALFKTQGKKHSGGGVDVLLEPESFVFSNDKSLAFDKEDCETFELDMGGSYKSNKNKVYTPAEVLKKNIDVKHYNTLTTNLQDVKKDDLAKKSSLMMLDKYFKTLGNIAFVQEGKKGFPQGVPEFAIGTAPVYDTGTKADIDEQKQYARYGGIINPSLQGGGKPKGYQNKPPNAQPGEWVMQADNLWYRADEIYPDSLGITPSGRKLYPDYSQNNKPTSGVSRRPDSGVPRIPDSGVPPIVPFVDYSKIPKLQGPPVSTPGHEIFYKDDIKPPVANEVTGDVQTGKEIDWAFTPWQKLSMGYDAYKYASAKRYMPMRSRFNPSYIDPALVNPEQMIGDIRNSGYQQSQAANTLSPILRNAQQNSIAGQMMNQVASVRSQYDNMNVGIENQTRQYNNQVRNTAQGVNMKNDQDYYQQSVIGQSQFDNMKSFLSDRLMNNIQGNVQDNQSLALQLMAQGPNPAYGYDFKRDRYTRNPQNILAFQGTQQGDYIGNILKNINMADLSNTERIQLLRELQRGKALQYLNPGFAGSPFGNQKRGGTLRKNPYQY